MEPVSIEFVLKGGIDKEVEKVKLAMKGMGDQSYLTFSHITKSSNDAFSSLSKGAQQQAISLQKVIQQLRENEAAQEALFRTLKEGKIASEEYARVQARLVTAQSELRQQANDLNRQLQQEVQQNRLVVGSLEDKISIISKLKEEYSKLNKEERDNVKIGGQLVERINELNKEVDDINGNFKRTTEEGGGLLDTMELLPGVVGIGVSQFRQLLTAAKSFVASPIGLAVAGIATAFSLLKIAIDGSDTATTNFNAKLSYMASRWSTFKEMITEGVAGMYNTVTGDFDAANKNFAWLTKLNIFQTQYANIAEEAAKDMDRIEDVLARNNDLTKLNNTSVAEYRQQLMDVNKTLDERKAIAKTIIDIEEDTRGMKMQNIKELYGNFILADIKGNDRINNEFSKEIELANRYFNTMTSGGELTITQQKELLGAINDITAGLDKSYGDEQKAKFRSFFTDAIDANKEFYDSTRRTSSTLAQMEYQESINAAKSASKTKLELLQEEVSLRKEQYTMLAAYERNMGKDAAQTAFGNLKAEGDTYTAYLTGKINTLKDKPGRTKEEDMNLAYLYQEQEANNPKTPDKFNPEPFKQAIEEKKKLYGEDINAYIDYLGKIRKLSEGDTTPAGTQKRILIDTAIQGAEEEKKTELDKLLTQYQSYTTKMASLGSSYQKDMSRLGEALTKATTDEEKRRISEAIDLRTDGYTASLAAMEAENAGFGKTLFGDISKLSKAALTKAITEAKAFIQKWKKSTDLPPEMDALLGKIQKGIDSAENTGQVDASDLKDVSTYLHDCASAASEFNEELGDSIENIAQIVGAMGKMASGDYVGAALTVITSVVSSIAKSNQESIARAKRTEGDYWDAVNWKIERQIELMKELNDLSNDQADKSLGNQINELTDILYNYDIKYRAKSGAENQWIYNNVVGGYDEALKKGDELGTKVLGKMKDAIGDNMWDLLDGKGNVKFDDVLGGLTTEELVALQGIPEVWRILPEEVQNYIKQLAEAVDKQKELEEYTKETLTNTTQNAITDSIVQGMLNGKRSAADFASDFEDMMRKAMMEAVKMKHLEKPLKDWYEQFATASENGLTEEKIAELRKQYDQIIEGATKEAENMEKITGINLSENAATQQARAGAFQAMGQDTGDELNGRFAALQGHTSHISEKVTSIADYLYLSVNHLAGIEENTYFCRRLENIEKILVIVQRDGLKVK